MAGTVPPSRATTRPRRRGLAALALAAGVLAAVWTPAAASAAPPGAAPATAPPGVAPATAPPGVAPATAPPGVAPATAPPGVAPATAPPSAPRPSRPAPTASPIWRTPGPPTATPAEDGETLPVTGAAATGLGVGGALLLAVGVLLVVLMRRRGARR
jgi:hypothetical protein